MVVVEVVVEVGWVAVLMADEVAMAVVLAAGAEAHPCTRRCNHSQTQRHGKRCRRT